MDGGSTTYEVARLLVGRPLQVVTNSLPVANLFAAHKNCDLVLLGGYVYPRTGVTLGPHANEMLARLNVRRTVLSVAGLNERGFFNSNLLLVETERAMMRAGEEVIVVADSTKFGHQSLAHLAALEDVQHLVVDNEITPEWREQAARRGHHAARGRTRAQPQRQPTAAERPPMTHRQRSNCTSPTSDRYAQRATNWPQPASDRSDDAPSIRQS